MKKGNVNMFISLTVVKSSVLLISYIFAGGNNTLSTECVMVDIIQ